MRITSRRERYHPRLYVYISAPIFAMPRRCYFTQPELALMLFRRCCCRAAFAPFVRRASRSRTRRCHAFTLTTNALTAAPTATLTRLLRRVFIIDYAGASLCRGKAAGRASRLITLCRADELAT